MLCIGMNRYQTLQTTGAWAVFDRLTRETLGGSGESRSKVRAEALTNLLNSLDDQESWKAEAELWPIGTVA